MVALGTEPALRKKALQTNSTDTSFGALADQVAEKPSGDGVYNTIGKNQIIVWPYGTDAANEAFNMRVVGWWKGNAAWGYSVLFEGLCTLGAEVGVASGDVLATEFYCDAITLTSSSTESIIKTTTADTPALALIDMVGCQYVQFQFDLTTAAAANSMYAFV